MIGVWWQPGATAALSELMDAGYAPAYQTVHVARDLLGVAIDGGLSHAGLAELGRAELERQLARALSGSPNRYGATDATAWLDDQLERADPSWWSVACQDGEPVGVVMPRRWAGDDETGTMAFLGLLPEARGRGLGVRLHADGLARLAAAGLRRYRDMTDVRNRAMMRVFARNGCQPVGVRHWMAPPA